MNVRSLLQPVVLVAILLAGSPYARAQSSTAGAGPAPSSRLDSKKVIPYRITRGDRLAVQVFDEPDLTAGNKRVEARGTINLALVGDVQVYGLTLQEASEAIKAAYRDGRFLRKPEVTVTVEEYSPRTVVVLGEVKSPGKVELPPEEQWTIKDVIAKVGGFGDIARGTNVIVTRKKPDGTSDVFKLDVQSTILGKDKASKSTDASFIIEPGDDIYVPQKMI